MKHTKMRICLFVVVVLYAGFLFITTKKSNIGKRPEIEVPESVLEVSVADGEDVLLKGIRASDTEDGDLSADVFVESISSFDAEMNRTVSYVVFDSDDQTARATRQIHYTDYVAPQFDIVKPICYSYLHFQDQYREFVSATSVVDGDLSSQILVENVYIENNIQYVDYSVVDSCGTKSTITLKADELKEEPNIEINLTAYLLKVDLGTHINPLDYVESIKTLGIENNSLINDLTIETDYNPNQSGMYEYIYQLSQTNGDYGISKLVVMVK